MAISGSLVRPFVQALGSQFWTAGSDFLIVGLDETILDTTAPISTDGFSMGLAALSVVAVAAQHYSSKASAGFTRRWQVTYIKKILALAQGCGMSWRLSLVTRLMSDTYQIQTGINHFFVSFLLRAPIIAFWLHHHGLYYQSGHYLVVLAHGGNFNWLLSSSCLADESSYMLRSSSTDRPAGSIWPREQLQGRGSYELRSDPAWDSEFLTQRAL